MNAKEVNALALEVVRRLLRVDAQRSVARDAAAGLACCSEQAVARVQTLALRISLEVIEEAVGEAQELLDRIETAAGLVGEDGRRDDE